MSFGTYKYGLRMRWVSNKYLRGGKQDCTSCYGSVSDDLELGQVSSSCFDVSVLRLRGSDCGTSACLCYCIKVRGDESERRSPSRKVIIRWELAARLYWRFLSQSKHQHSLQVDEIVPVQGDNGLHISGHGLPGLNDPSFLIQLCRMMSRKFNDRFCSQARTVTPDLYSLWILTSRITMELFADSLNESGTVRDYCSAEKEDTVFGAVGTWEEVEDTVEGAAGNPPFNKKLLQEIVSKFDRGAQGTVPYCRCVILPLGKTYGMIERIMTLSSKGIMLMRIPPGCLPFRRQEGYFTLNARPVPHEFQELGIFIWRNREYLEKYPPPHDVELLYLNWVATACVNPSTVFVDLDAFSKSFPQQLRSEQCLLPSFMDGLKGS